MNELLLRECIEALLDGNVSIDDETGIVSVDLTEEGKNKLCEYAIQHILLFALASEEENFNTDITNSVDREQNDEETK